VFKASGLQTDAAAETSATPKFRMRPSANAAEPNLDVAGLEPDARDRRRHHHPDLASRGRSDIGAYTTHARKRATQVSPTLTVAVATPSSIVSPSPADGHHLHRSDC
jgi:hypothetical protein